jgi:hypothetical protein
MSALVEKNFGLDGNRTLIHGGFCAWCNAGSIFAQDISAEAIVPESEKQTGLHFRPPGKRLIKRELIG